MGGGEPLEWADDAAAEAAPAPVWGVFGDLMTGLVGAVVLLLIGVLVMQIDLVANLQAEIGLRREAESRWQALERALAVPLAAGRVTLADGRIGISGSVLFALNSDELSPEGQELLRSLAEPLRVYLAERDDEVLMVSGFTDDRPIQPGNRRFADNLELSAQRALTVTRALIAAGLPSSQVFSAAFGAEQPVAPNDHEAGRALNRRVEIAPVPRAHPASAGERP
jgi:flagellar motor protein MotB